MTVSDKNYQKGFNILLVLIASTILFSKISHLLIIIFIVYNLIFIKKYKFPKRAFFLWLIIISPLLLEIIFFWKNDSYRMGLKSLEKTIPFLFIPYFIISNYKIISFFKILSVYAKITTLIIFILLIRFVWIDFDVVKGYINGVNIWEMGYSFTNSFDKHAPIVNMHIAFVCVINFYFLVKSFIKKQKVLNILSNFTITATSFFLLLIVNTRIALLNALIGFLIILFVEAFKFYNTKKIILISLGFIATIIFTIALFINFNPYMKEKYTTVSFSHMDKIGRLDEIENPESTVFNSFVTRISIWKSACELSEENLITGYGSSDASRELVEYYKKTDQKFLAKYGFHTHNQYLDYLLKFGIIGLITLIIYLSLFLYLGIKTNNGIIISLFVNLFISNLFDNFITVGNGLIFSCFWLSFFTAYYLSKNQSLYKGANC